MDWKALVIKLHIVDRFIDYGFKILLIIFAIGIIFRILDLFFHRISNLNFEDVEQHKKVKTIYSLLNSTIKVVVLIIGLMFILQTLNINIAPILATAGVLGIAVGFGSQRMVERLEYLISKKVEIIYIIFKNHKMNKLKMMLNEIKYILKTFKSNK